MFETLKKNIAAIIEKNPAALNTPEVRLCYPGLYAERRSIRERLSDFERTAVPSTMSGSNLHPVGM